MKYERLIVTVFLRICTIVVCLVILPYCKINSSGICDCIFLWVLYVLISFIGLVLLLPNLANCSEKSAMLTCILSLLSSLIFAVIAIHLGHIIFAGTIFLASIFFISLEYKYLKL